MPKRPMKRRWKSLPASRAMRAEPILDEWIRISGTLIQRFWAWSSWMVWLPNFNGLVASKLELMFTRPLSSAMAVLNSLKVEPIS